MKGVTLGLTDCRIMETRVSLAQESNAQIAQGCLGIERNTFHHSRFHVGDGCDPAEGEDFTANTRGGTLNMYESDGPGGRSESRTGRSSRRRRPLCFSSAFYTLYMTVSVLEAA